MSNIINDKNIVPGCIYRIGMKDFLSYRNVTIYPDIGLNMIIGPNGSGKSTVVCALILGFAGKITSTGRTKHITDFIRTGCTESHIEIEVYNKPGERNIIIERHFTIKGNSTWCINGKPAKEKDVLNIASSMNIQVENLCQLLPQERVQDFAKMDPRQLLRSTLLAVGGTTSVQQLDELIQCQKVQQESAHAKAQSQQNLEELIRLNDSLKQRIQTLEEKKSIEKELEMCNKKNAWILYDRLREQCMYAKDQKKRAQDAWRQRDIKARTLAAETVKIKKKLQTLEAHNAKDQSDVANMKNIIETKMSDVTLINFKLKEAEDMFNLKINQANAYNTELESNLQKLEELTLNKQEMLASSGGEAAIKQKLNAENANMANIKREMDAITKKKLDSQYTLDNRYVPKITEYSNTISTLEDVDKKRLKLLQDINKECYDAFLWYQENKHIFVCESYGPMFLELTFNEQKYARHLGNIVAQRDLVAFSFEHPSDMNKFLQTVRVERKLKRVNALCISQKKMKFTFPCSIDKISYLGFHKFLSETFTAPDVIYNFICDHYKAYKVPLGSALTAQKADKVPEIFNSFFSDTHLYTQHKSRYSSDRTLTVREARLSPLLTNTYDAEEIQRHKSCLASVESSAKKYKEMIAKCQQQLEEKSGLLSKLDTRTAVYKDLLDKLTTILVRSKVQVEKVQNIRQKIHDFNLESERMNLKAAQERLTKEQFKMTMNVIEMLKQLNLTVVRAELWPMKFSKMKKIVLDSNSANEQAQADLSTAALQLKELEIKAAKLKEQGKKQMEEAKVLCDNTTPDDPKFPFKSEFESLPGTLEEMQTRIQELEARLMCLAPEDVAIINEYQRRAEEIESLKVAIQGFGEKSSDLIARMERIKEQWLPPVYSLVQEVNERFSEMFIQMGCVGEVKLDKGGAEDEYNKYGIAILVSFRGSELVQRLNAFAQSGGERTLSTAVYLLAMQRLTTVPFRCVDEINQGMDAINERAIFELLVKITTQFDNVQYFLLTPKLLLNLDYGDRALVHTIMNGKNIAKFDTDAFSLNTTTIRNNRRQFRRVALPEAL